MDRVTMEILARDERSAVLRLKGRRAPLLLLTPEAFGDLRAIANALEARAKNKADVADRIDELQQYLAALDTHFEVERERFSAYVMESSKRDANAAAQKLNEELLALKELQSDDGA
jgi:hypothetical protein